MSAFRAGLLKDRIQFLRRAPAQSPATGRPVDMWLPLVLRDGSPTEGLWLPAEAYDLLPSGTSTMEFDRNNVKLGRLLTRFRTRFRDDVTPDMRILLLRRGGNLTFSIVTGPALINNGRWLEMLGERYTS